MKVYETYVELSVEGIFWGNNIADVILKKCLGGYINEKTGSIFNIDREHGKNS